MEEDVKNKAKDIAKTISDNFKEVSTIPKWNTYSAVSKFKSVKRAIRRGHVDLFLGVVYPDRPFNNRKPTLGRRHNELKKTIYGQLKQRAV